MPVTTGQYIIQEGKEHLATDQLVLAKIEKKYIRNES